MKKKRLLILFFALMFVSLASVKASTCSDSKILELSSLANNVKVSYEKENRISSSYVATETEEETNDTFPAFYITVFNLDDKLNISVTREDTKKTIYGTSKDKSDDGVVYVDAGFANLVKTFTVKIRSNDSNCQNEVLKTITITTPMYNLNSQYDVCKEYSDFNLCKEFTTIDYSDVSQKLFNEELEKYKQEKAEEKRASSVFYRIFKFILKYKWIFITIAIVIAATVSVYFINRKKSRLV